MLVPLNLNVAKSLLEGPDNPFMSQTGMDT